MSPSQPTCHNRCRSLKITLNNSLLYLIYDAIDPRGLGSWGDWGAVIIQTEKTVATVPSVQLYVSTIHSVAGVRNSLGLQIVLLMSLSNNTGYEMAALEKNCL